MQAECVYFTSKYIKLLRAPKKINTTVYIGLYSELGNKYLDCLLTNTHISYQITVRDIKNDISI